MSCNVFKTSNKICGIVDLPIERCHSPLLNYAPSFVFDSDTDSGFQESRKSRNIGEIWEYIAFSPEARDFIRHLGIGIRVETVEKIMTVIVGIYFYVRIRIKKNKPENPFQTMTSQY